MRRLQSNSAPAVNVVTGFPPIAEQDAVILILGSMPSTKSLQAQQYYAHPRNSFWYIMTRLLSGDNAANYEQRKALLLEHRIALWDVLNSCRRTGSLDSSIENGTTVVNDFNRFFAAHPAIKAVFFNGSRAQQEYNRHVLPVLDAMLSDIHYHRLPSTSPAMASLRREQKLQYWRVILQFIDCIDLMENVSK